MKIAFPFILAFFVLLISCSDHRHVNVFTQPPASIKVIGHTNTDSVSPPVVTLLTGANAPRVVAAGKPLVIKNPNADGLGDPVFTHYGTEKGLPLENVTATCTDKWGNLWICTLGGGVCKFDGTNFTVYAQNNGLDNGIYNIASDTAGNLYFNAGDAQVYKYDGVTFVDYSSTLGLTGHSLGTIAGDKKGNLWLGLGEGVIQFNASKGTRLYTKADGLPENHVNAIAEDKAGNIWLGTSSGASRFDGAHFTNYNPGASIVSIATDRQGDIWFGTNNGVWVFNGKNFVSYTMKDGLPSNSVNVVFGDSYGYTWIGTDKGVSKYDTTPAGRPRFTNYDKTHGLSNNVIVSISEDITGCIWFATSNGGICKYDPNGLTQYTTALGLAGSEINSIIQDRSGNIWMAMNNVGLCKYDGTTFTNYGVQQGVPNIYVNCLAQDRAGNIWLGCYGYLCKFDGKSFTSYGQQQGVPENAVLNMVQDSAGNLWASSWGGLTRYDGKSITHYTTAQGLGSNEVLGLMMDHAGNIWASGNSVDRFDGQHFTKYRTSNGPPFYEVPMMLEDRNQNIWMGSYGNGIFKLRNESLAVYNTTDGLGDNTVFSIREDKTMNALWLGTNKGLSLLKYIGSPGTESISFENFNAQTGFPIKDFSFKNSLCLDKNGIIWGGTGDEKVIRFDYHFRKKIDHPFQLQIRNIAINNDNICWNLLLNKQQPVNKHDSLAIVNEMVTTFGKVLSYTEANEMIQRYGKLQFDSIQPYNLIPQNLVLPYRDNDISFEFAAIQPGFENRVKYQYMLEGYDDDWSTLNYFTNADFGNIHEGDYTFRVKAVNPFGVWSEQSYSFTVLPPWYRTWWAYIIYAFLFLVSLWMFSKWRERNLRSEKEKLEHKVEERTLELKGTLESLQSTQAQLIQSEKMASLGELTAGIAHEIQNPLNFVNNFSDVNKELLLEMKEEIAKGNLDDVKLLADDVIANEEKINHHGKRADAIVKGMLQHSRVSSGKKELADINALTDEYLRLSYHGLRAKDKSFNATIAMQLDPAAGAVLIIPQDIGRVLLNIFNNAFYSVSEKKKQKGDGYEPRVSVTTKRTENSIEIIIEDNGMGIPQKVVDKIFQPFFTTKPTGQGTGLGLSLSYDIIKGHDGTLTVQTRENEFAVFTITLPAK